VFIKCLCLVTAGFALVMSRASAITTVIVPTDQPTIQGAVNAAGEGGTVIINSDATFDETVTVTHSLTIHGGVGFRPTIRASGMCGTASCALFFNPNSAAPQMLAVSDLRLHPNSGLSANTEVVRVLNRGTGEASMILSNFSIQNPETTSGFLAFNIRRFSCTSGLNTVSVQSGSINIVGSDENAAGRGGFVMNEGGSLFVSDVDVIMSRVSGDAFNIANTPDCGQIIFGLYDSDITVASPTTGVADLGKIIRGVTATLERNRFNMASIGEGGAGGFLIGGGTGQTYSASITLNRNRFFASGPDRGIPVLVLPSSNGSVMLQATNNVLHGVHTGFRLGQNLNNPAGSVVATVANNTVDGCVFDAISIHSAEGSTVTVTAANNLLTHNEGWGISVASEPGGSLTVTSDYNGFFANAAGNVQAPLSVGPHDVVDDPIYVDYPDDDFRLGLGSSMINAGDNALVSTASDFLGAMRVQGGTVDIGAFEGGFPVSGATNTPSATPTPSATATRTPTRTATHTRTPTPSPTLTYTLTATPTCTATPSFTQTFTPTPTNTPSPTFTYTLTATPTRTATPSFTQTSTATPTFTPSPTFTCTLTVTPTPTPTAAILRSGDLNCDAVVSAADLPALVKLLPSGQPGSCGGDLTGDGAVDEKDIGVLIDEIYSDATQTLSSSARLR